MLSFGTAAHPAGLIPSAKPLFRPDASCADCCSADVEPKCLVNIRCAILGFPNKTSTPGSQELAAKGADPGCPTSLEVGRLHRTFEKDAARLKISSHNYAPRNVPSEPYKANFGTFVFMDIGYARVSTAKQDLDRQIEALRSEGIPDKYIYLDKRSGSTTNRPGLQEALDQAREGDVVVVHTLDRLGRTVRDTLNLIHDLASRGIGVRNLADPIRIDSANPNDPMSQLAVVMLALFGQMERTYAVERAAHARAVATSKGKRTGRPSVIDPAKLAYAEHLRDQEGLSISEIVKATGITRTSLYRHLPPRPPESLTAEGL